MSASVVPPPPPPEAPPPLPEEPPPPTTPPEPMDGTQQYFDMQQSHFNQLSAGNAAYPYAQQPMYQYPLQQPYTQAYNPYTSPYSAYNSWQAPPVPSQYGALPSYPPYHSTQPYQAHAAVPQAQAAWDSVAASTPGASAAPNSFNSATSGTISFSLDGTSRPGATAAPHFSMTTDAAAQRTLPSAQAPVHPSQSSTPAAQPTQADKGQALKDWIKRALQKYETHNSNLLRQTMKLILEEKRAQGVLYTHDWDREPLPVLPPMPLPAPSASQSSALKMHGRRDSPRRETNRKSAANTRQFDRGPPVSESSFAVSKRKKKLTKQSRDRASRFASTSDRPAPNAPAEPVWNPDVIIKGTCQSIEKSFLRLNGVPKSEEVRPEPVLIQALDRIITMIAGGEKDFMYIWSQLKAIRQDLTVQHIRNATTVRTEEAFARSALEHADQQEVRKCVSTLQAMYDEGLPGCKAEFGAYQLLLYICVEQKDRALSFSRAVVQLVAQGVWDTAAVQHAMSVYQAISSCNYVRFWKLYTTAPNCGRLVMDWGVRKLRFEAVQGLVTSYRTVALDMCMRVLGFLHEADPVEAREALPLPGASAVLCVGGEGVVGHRAQRQQLCVQCLHAHGGITELCPDGKPVLHAKESAGRIILPKQEQASARAVGNTHLDCTAFLKEISSERGTRNL